MKKILCGLLFMCMVLSAQAQMKPLQDQRFISGDVLTQLEGLVDKFCEYVEFIGTTPVNEKEKVAFVKMMFRSCSTITKSVR